VTQYNRYQQLEIQQHNHNSKIENHIVAKIKRAIDMLEGKINTPHDKEYGLNNLLVAAESVLLIESNQDSVFRSFRLQIVLKNIISDVYQAEEYSQQIKDLKIIYQYLNNNTDAYIGEINGDITEEEYEAVLEKYML
jgi:hypothetical protein